MSVEIGKWMTKELCVHTTHTEGRSHMISIYCYPNLKAPSLSQRFLSLIFCCCSCCFYGFWGFRKRIWKPLSMFVENTFWNNFLNFPFFWPNRGKWKGVLRFCGFYKNSPTFLNILFVLLVFWFDWRCNLIGSGGLRLMHTLQLQWLDSEGELVEVLLLWGLFGFWEN